MSTLKVQFNRPASGVGTLLMSLLFCVVLACSDDSRSAASTQDSRADGAASNSSTPGFPLSMLCADGYQLELDGPPQRVIPANATALDFVMALVEADRIAALSEISIPYAIASEEFKDWPEEKTFTNFIVEEMVVCDPDLIIVHEWQNAQTVAILREAGFAVLVIHSMSKLEDCFDNLQLLGTVLGVEDAAQTKIDELKERIAALRASNANSETTLLSYTNFGTGGTCAGGGSSFDVMLGIAGLSNAAANAGVNGFENVDIEWLLSVDPDWIVVGESVEAPGTSSTGSFLRSTASLQGLSAVRENRIIRMSAALFNTSSFQLVDSAEDLLGQMRAWSGD